MPPFKYMRAAPNKEKKHEKFGSLNKLSCKSALCLVCYSLVLMLVRCFAKMWCQTNSPIYFCSTWRSSHFSFLFLLLSVPCDGDSHNAAVILYRHTKIVWLAGTCSISEKSWKLLEAPVWAGYLSKVWELGMEEYLWFRNINVWSKEEELSWQLGVTPTYVTMWWHKLHVVYVVLFLSCMCAYTWG